MRSSAERAHARSAQAKRRGIQRAEAIWGPALDLAVDRLDSARTEVLAASDVRAAAVWRARRAGATLAAIGERLGGMARKNVLELERRGALVIDRGELSVPAIPPRRLGVVVALPVAPVAEGPACLREGCPFPADAGKRFCHAHLWN